jgi:hypothetical protein
MHVGRDNDVPKFSAFVEGGTVRLKFEEEAFDSHRVMLLDLEEESRRQKDAGFKLVFE